MPVNSAQDATTALKRRILAATISTDPPAGKNRIPSTYLAIRANNASLVSLKVGVLGGELITSDVCVVATPTLAGSLL